MFSLTVLSKSNPFSSPRPVLAHSFVQNRCVCFSRCCFCLQFPQFALSSLQKPVSQTLETVPGLRSLKNVFFIIIVLQILLFWGGSRSGETWGSWPRSPDAAPMVGFLKIINGKSKALRLWPSKTLCKIIFSIILCPLQKHIDN